MSFDIKFDYRFDESGFFTPEKKEILELAGDIWSSYIQDEFSPIAAGETVRFSLNSVEQQVTLDEPIDDLMIFVSYADLSPNENFLAKGTFHANFIIGSDRQERIQGDDFQPWLGTIEFNQAATDKFYFDDTLETDDDIPFDQQDFLSLSLHEIGHILGIGISNSFLNQVENGEFTGTTTVDLNGGQGVPLDDNHSHIEDGFSLDSDSDDLLDQVFTFGERILPTDLNLAILDDIGYDINAFEQTPVHRFFQYDRGFHFYTVSDIERENIIERSDTGELNYNYENVAYRVLAKDTDNLTGEKIEGALPIYRFFNRQTGAHFFTISEFERDYIIDNLSNYDFENVAYYAFESQPENLETIPLYRMLNTQSGAHLFTTSEFEFNSIQENLPHFEVEANDGITFYVLDSF